MPMAMFDGAAATYDQWYTTATGRVVETVEWQCALDLMDLTPGMHVLDAGCGTGRLAKVMAEKGCRVTGVDQSPGMLAEARKRLAEQAEVTLIEGDLEVLPFDANHFDLVVSMATFAFLEEPEAVLDELFRVVKPGGRVVVGIITAEGAWGQLYKSRAFREDPVFSRARFLRPEDLARYHENEWIQTSGCLYLGPGEEPFTVEADRALSGERKAGFACVAWEKERR